MHNFARRAHIMEDGGGSPHRNRQRSDFLNGKLKVKLSGAGVRVGQHES